MIQTHQQLITISEEYNTLFSKNEFYPIQKAYTTPHFLVLGLRFPGRNVAMYIGRGNQYQGIFISPLFPPSFLRIQDRFLDYVRKHLVGARLGKMEVDEKYFLALFHFKNEHRDNSFSFGYKDRQLFFVKQSGEETYTSWNGQTVINGNIISLVDAFLGEKLSNHLENPASWSLEKYLEDEKKKVSGKPVQKKKEKFLEKKMQNISRDLADVKNWRLIEQDLLSEELMINLDDQQVILHGHKIKFPSQISQWGKRDIVFTKIKKLKRAEEILSSRLAETSAELILVKQGSFQFEFSKEKAIPPLWEISSGKRSKQVGEYNIQNFKMGHYFGAIAKDAKSNDWLRSQSTKDHYWFHVENYAGAHCIIKTDDISGLSQGELSAIASILRDYSQLTIMEIPVVFSQLKNVKGIKGSPGKVLVKKPKYLRCNYIDWKEIIAIT